MKASLVAGVFCALFVAALADCDSVIETSKKCKNYCLNNYGASIFIFSSDQTGTSCSCEDNLGNEIQICTTTTTTVTTTTSTTSTSTTTAPYIPLTGQELRSHLTGLIGDQCGTAFNASITDEVADCFGDFIMTSKQFDSMTADEFVDEVCETDCTYAMFTAMQELANVNCLPTEDDDTIFNGMDDIISQLYNLQYHGERIQYLCAKSKDRENFCGSLLPRLQVFRAENSTAGRGDCTFVVANGNCLGTLLEAGEENPMYLQPYIAADDDISDIICEFGSFCRARDIRGVLAAAGDSENVAVLTSPSSSSASQTSAVALSVVIAGAVAAFFA